MRVFSVLVPLFLLAPVLTVADGAATGSTTAPAAQDGRVRVAVGNVREGSLVDYPVDRRSDSDRRRFARLVLRGAPPDVVLLQEVLGTAGHVAAALNARARAGGVPARYAVATGTAHGHSRGHCDGARAGRFSLLRSSSILVNTRTVTDVRRRAAIRTWGRWGRQAWPATGRRGFGCTEHPAAQVTVRTPEGMLTAQLVSAHVAPVGPLLKGRAIDTLRGELAARHRDARTDLALLGGDLNMTRCRYQAKGETVGCEPRAPHRRLSAAGFRDVVRSVHPSGPTGVAGVVRRIDFLYAMGEPVSGWWDRCYQAYRVHRWRCGAARTTFGRQRTFHACQARALWYGRPGRGCRARMFRQYYSDHPLVLGAVAPPAG